MLNKTIKSKAKRKRSMDLISLKLGDYTSQKTKYQIESKSLKSQQEEVFIALIANKAFISRTYLKILVIDCLYPSKSIC